MVLFKTSGQAGVSTCNTNRPALSRHSCLRGAEHRCIYFLSNFMLCAINNQSTEHCWILQSKKYIHQIQSINLWLKINRNTMRTSVQPCVPYMLRNMDCGLQCESTLSSFGLRTHRKVTQVYFYWPGLSFTSWIQIVIMTNEGVW